MIVAHNAERVGRRKRDRCTSGAAPARRRAAAAMSRADLLGLGVGWTRGRTGAGPGASRRARRAPGGAPLGLSAQAINSSSAALGRVLSPRHHDREGRAARPKGRPRAAAPSGLRGPGSAPATNQGPTRRSLRSAGRAERDGRGQRDAVLCDRLQLQRMVPRSRLVAQERHRRQVAQLGASSPRRADFGTTRHVHGRDLLAGDVVGHVARCAITTSAAPLRRALRLTVVSSCRAGPAAAACAARPAGGSWRISRDSAWIVSAPS